MSLTYKIEPGGSGNGITDALKRMRCGRLAHYDSLKPKVLAESEGTLTGTMAHAFVEIYTSHDANFDPEQVTFIHDEQYERPSYWPYANLEAIRMFNAYRKRFSPTLGGALVSAEQAFEVTTHNGITLEKPLTARLDAIYEFGDENELGIPKGKFCIDYKFLGQFGANDRAQYEYSAQAAWYRHVLYANGVSVDGVVFIVGVKTKVPRFEIVLAEPFSQEALQNLIAKMIEKPNQERSFNCMSKWGYCPHAKKCLGENANGIS